MKTPVKTLALVAFLSLAASAAQAAESRNCLTEAPAPVAKQAVPADMGKIEAALKAGQISPYEAGRLMRQQWELAQFQRGFLEGGEPLPNAAAGGCGGSDLSINLAPIGDMASTMAKNGVQTASKVMRAVIKETERLLKENKEKAAAEGDPM